MTRIVWIAVLFIFIVGSYFFVSHIKDSYKILPMDMNGEDMSGEFDDTWFTYQDPDGRFKVLLPIIPQYAKETMNDPNIDQKRVYDMYVAERGDGTTFMITLITFETAPGKDKEKALLKTIADEMMASNSSNQFEEIEYISKNGGEILDFTIQNPTTQIHANAFLKGKVIVVLATLVKDPGRQSVDFDKFAESFEMTSKDLP